MGPLQSGVYVQFSAILAIIRLPNLVMLGAIQSAAGYFLCNTPVPLLTAIVVMTGSAAAAGYIINDLQDRTADLQNGRTNMISSGQIPERLAWRLYAVCVVTGGICALGLTALYSYHFLWIYVVMTVTLWWYTPLLKGTRFWGNIAVSMLCALAILLVCLTTGQWDSVSDGLWWLSGFAFVLTWIREIVKDLEDMDGDRQAGYRTLPVASGVQLAKVLSIALCACSLAVLFLPVHFPDAGAWWKVLCWIMTAVLLGYSCFIGILSARNARQYHQVSTVLKIAMLTGSCYLIF